MSTDVDAGICARDKLRNLLETTGLAIANTDHQAATGDWLIELTEPDLRVLWDQTEGYLKAQARTEGLTMDRRHWETFWSHRGRNEAALRLAVEMVSDHIEDIRCVSLPTKSSSDE